MSVDRRYHHGFRCHYCGASAGREHLQLVALKDTRAAGLVCRDIVACIRRQTRLQRAAA